LPWWLCSLELHLLLGNVSVQTAFEKSSSFVRGSYLHFLLLRSHLLSTSWLCRLTPSSFNIGATPPDTPPPGLCVLLIARLHDHGCVSVCTYLCVGSSWLRPLTLWGYASSPSCFSGGLGDRLGLARHSHECWLGYRSPSGVCTTLGFPAYMTQVYLSLV